MYYILDGKKIRELMEQQNMNVSKLSELSGVSQSCIRNILNEKAREYPKVCVNLQTDVR